jgi:hypothetical protein
MIEHKDPGPGFGFSREQALALWESADWRGAVTETCVTIAACDHAHIADRELALAVWGTLITVGYADNKTGVTPMEVIRDVQLACVRGRKGPLDEQLRKDCHERMLGVRWTMETIAKFVDIRELISGALDREAQRLEDPSSAN